MTWCHAKLTEKTFVIVITYLIYVNAIVMQIPKFMHQQ